MTRPPTLRHTKAATVNIGDGPTGVKLARLLRIIALGVTLIGFQEASDRRALMRLLRRRDPAWRIYQPFRLPGGGADPIAYNHREWKVMRLRSILAVARTWIGPAGAGPTTAKAKRVTVAVLRNRATGQTVMHLNTHPIPSVRRKLSRTEHDARLTHYRRQIATVVRIIAHHPGRPVIVTLDANAVPTDELLTPLHRLGLTGWTDEPTLGQRAVDHVLTRGLGHRLPDVVPFSPADHAAVTREITLRDAT